VPEEVVQVIPLLVAPLQLLDQIQYSARLPLQAVGTGVLIGPMVVLQVQMVLTVVLVVAAQMVGQEELETRRL
jgi:hypothetical protein